MEYESAEFKALLHNERALKKAYSPAVIKKLRIRLTSIREASSLEELHRLPGRTHPLGGDRKGRFAMDLSGSLRLEFRPTPPVPHKPDGGIDVTSVTRVTIIEISDHYR